MGAVQTILSIRSRRRKWTRCARTLRWGTAESRRTPSFFQMGVSVYWTAYTGMFLRLWTDIKAALSMCAQKSTALSGIGIDTWGVDFGLLGKR